ncbi:MAG: type III-A CRISPR-associated RAMP protein Csm5 [Anaerolineae bacterium]|nr:type III-A CRISPR-associated RAMP protein Csm5 [Anaerolineae bacterium]
MSFEYTLYDVTVTTLTPLYIGSGRILLNEYDYTTHGHKTWRINEDALLDAIYVEDDPKSAETLARTPPGQLLAPKDFTSDNPYFRYVLSEQPRAAGPGAQLQELLKTVEDEAYLPGSSLKGAIRTALAWHGWQEKHKKPDLRDLERNRKYAGRRIEQEIMGPDPNHDLLRALHVSDSAPAGKDRFLVLNVQVITAGGMQSPIELEAIQADTPFRLTMKVDNRLWGQWAKQNRLTLGGNVAWLTELPTFIQAHTQQRLQDELAWAKERSIAKTMAGFYEQLVGLKLPKHRCLFQIGWGAGWADKTYGSHLQANPRFMDAIVKDYRLSIGNNHRPGDPFPKSRRTTVRVVKDKRGQVHQQPAVPLGWVLMEMKER